MLKSTSLITFILFTTLGFSQNSDLSKQLPKPIVYDQLEVLDSADGITLYEPLNFRLGGDSIRNEKGYAFNGWKKDYYQTGELIHKGFYVDGQLKIYRNFYPNGDVERIFNVIDDYKSMMKVYYQGDILKSQIKYVGAEPKKWEDFYPNGYLEYYEEIDRNNEYYKIQKSYYSSGKLASIFELVNKKDLLYTMKKFHENGNNKVVGQSKYSQTMMDYLKMGIWKYYDESGKLIKEEEYILGRIEKETSY